RCEPSGTTSKYSLSKVTGSGEEPQGAQPARARPSPTTVSSLRTRRILVRSPWRPGGLLLPAARGDAERAEPGRVLGRGLPLHADREVGSLGHGEPRLAPASRRVRHPQPDLPAEVNVG